MAEAGVLAIKIAIPMNVAHLQPDSWHLYTEEQRCPDAVAILACAWTEEAKCTTVWLLQHCV